MSTAEAALVLGVSEDVLKMRLHRAKQRVRDTLYNRIHREDVELFAFYAPRCDRVVASVLEAIHQLRTPE